jgi:HK97 family phage major capsid protein
MMFREVGGTFYREAVGLAGSSNDSGRLITYKLSDSSVGRDNHRILAGAWQYQNFLRNPIMPWAHLTDQPPIAKWVDLWERGDEFFGVADYADADTYPFADTIFRLVKGGFLNAVSAGWIPLEFKYTNDRSRPGGIDFSKVELLECSQVPVPALPTALVTARSHGIDTAPIHEWTERMLDSGNPSMLPRSELEVLRREAKMPSTAKRGETVVMPKRRSKFASLAEFVRAAIDVNLHRAPSGSNTPDVTAGGFLVQTEFSQKWIASVYAGASPFLGLCDQRQTDNPLAKITIPAIDETSRADGFRNGGMFGYWEKEGDLLTASLPKWRMVETAGYKLIVLVFATNQLLSDNKMLEAFLNKGVPEELAFLLGQKAISGSGAGVPLGIINAPATITLAKTAGQTPGTIVRENVLGMWARLSSPSRRRAVWLVNEDVDGQLEILASDPAGPSNIYIPSGVCGNEFPLLKGRPVIEIEQCPVLGQPGDIILADLSQYLIIDGGLRSAVSMEVSFLNDQAVLKFTWYVDGRPSVATPVLPYNGSSVTRSPFVTLPAR